MKALLAVSRVIDAMNERLGRLANWMVLVACLISAGNAMMRYAFDLSSNAWLEVQWYLFAGIVMLGASYTLRLNEHVRVDILYAHMSERAKIWLDLIGALVFLIPACILIAWLSWPFFHESWLIQEMSTNAGGLLRWPVKILIPLGFVLLVLQAVSEVIKRAASLQGSMHYETHYEKPVQ